METFCTEALLVRGINIEFRPEKQFPKKKKTVLNISFLNVSPETPDEPLTDFLADYVDIVGEPLYIQKDHNGILYFKGTRVYQVKVLHQCIPRHIHGTSGRTVLYIYNNQQPLRNETNQNNNQRVMKYKPKPSKSE